MGMRRHDLNRFQLQQILQTARRSNQFPLSPPSVRRCMGESIVRCLILKHVLQFMRLVYSRMHEAVDQTRNLFEIEQLQRFDRLEEAPIVSEAFCSICFETLETGNCVSLPICKHIFHRFCVRRWVESSSSNNCPICRQNVIET